MLLAADQVHQVGHVGLVEDREVGREPERPAVKAQQPVGDGVERPAPDFARARWRVHEATGARDSISRAARRENVSSRMRSGGTPSLDQVRDAAGERPGLARCPRRR